MGFLQRPSSGISENSRFSERLVSEKGCLRKTPDNNLWHPHTMDTCTHIHISMYKHTHTHTYYIHTKKHPSASSKYSASSSIFRISNINVINIDIGAVAN